MEKDNGHYYLGFRAQGFWTGGCRVDSAQHLGFQDVGFRAQGHGAYRFRM